MLDGLRWHFIGQAQTNKAKAIRAAASVVHSVDRTKIADALDAAASGRSPALDVLLQVNLTDDPGRGGVAPRDLERLAEHVERMPHPAPARRDGGRAARRGARAARSRACAGYAERVRGVVPDATWISAGMTADLPRGDRRRRDTPADRLGNHGPEARRTVNLETDEHTRRMRCRTR